jgi:hypothetical protein
MTPPHDGGGPLHSNVSLPHVTVVVPPLLLPLLLVLVPGSRTFQPLLLLVNQPLVVLVSQSEPLMHSGCSAFSTSSRSSDGEAQAAIPRTTAAEAKRP